MSNPPIKTAVFFISPYPNDPATYLIKVAIAIGNHRQAFFCAVIISGQMAQYEDYLFTYMDILGFSKRIEKSVDDAAEMAQIIEVLHQMERQISIGSPTVSTQNFSDLVIRAVPLAEVTDLAITVNLECIMLAGIQCKLLLDHGILIQGGICLEKFYMQQGFAFGPALVKSHHLAEHIAIYPRVIVDSKIMKIDDPNNTVQTFIERGDDAAYYLDYLLASFFNQQLVFSHYDRDDILSKHKERVEEKLNQLQGDERVRQKALWLTLYHNTSINKLIGSFGPKRHEFFRTLLIPVPDE